MNPFSINYRLAIYLSIIAASFFIGWCINGNRLTSKYNLEASSKKVIELENIRLIERGFMKKIAESEANYAKQKSRILGRADAIDTSGLRVKPRDCGPKSPADTSGADIGSAGGRPGAGGVDFEDVAREIARIGKDYDLATAKIKELSSLLAKCMP
jgi:hypothetical protein